jgi:hypothetical protein
MIVEIGNANLMRITTANWARIAGGQERYRRFSELADLIHCLRPQQWMMQYTTVGRANQLSVPGSHLKINVSASIENSTISNRLSA